MNTNKIVRRRIRILVLLMLYVGLCIEVAAFPPDVMAVGERHELEGGYSIAVVKVNVETGGAVFYLYKEEKVVDMANVVRGNRFGLDDGEKFQFKAMLDSVFRSEDALMVKLVEYDWEWREPPEEEVVPTPYPGPDYSFYLIIFLIFSLAIGLPLMFFIYRASERQAQQKPPEHEDHIQKMVRPKKGEGEREGDVVSRLKEELEEKKPKNAYGVVIGIGTYKDEGIPALKYAREDAIAIYNILTDPHYGNFPRENVKLLLDEQATLTAIKSAMGTFLARNAGTDDMVCIYFAGHGSPELDPTGKAEDHLEKFIVPYDAKKDDLFGHALSMDTVRKILDERIESKRAIFFIDSCYSGEAGGRTFSRPEFAARNITISEKFIEQLSGEGRIVITASKPDELSLELDELKHGLFTYYLVEGLKGKADSNEDGFVTVDELYSYVYKQVEAKARLLGGTQHPLKKGTSVGDIQLTRCETEALMRIKALNSEARRLFAAEDYEAARARWNDVLKVDRKNAEALAGIEASKKRVEETKAIIREKQKRLLVLYNSGLPSKEYDEAMILLKKNPRTYTDLERKIVNYMEELLKGAISSEVYVDTLKLIRED